MKTIKIMLICLLAASSVFAQSKQKTKHKTKYRTKTTVKTEKLVENTDFEVVAKEFTITSGPGMASTQKPYQATREEHLSFLIKSRIDSVEIQSVLCGNIPVEQPYKDIQPPLKLLRFNYNPQSLSIDYNNIKATKFLIMYKKKGILKRYIITDFETIHRNEG